MNLSDKSDPEKAEIIQCFVDQMEQVKTSVVEAREQQTASLKVCIPVYAVDTYLVFLV